MRRWANRSGFVQRLVRISRLDTFLCSEIHPQTKYSEVTDVTICKAANFATCPKWEHARSEGRYSALVRVQRENGEAVKRSRSNLANPLTAGRSHSSPPRDGAAATARARG